jgi:hypothetical protein
MHRVREIILGAHPSNPSHTSSPDHSQSNVVGAGTGVCHEPHLSEAFPCLVAMKRRNPRRGCPRIAQQIALAFGVEIDKDVVSGSLSAHCRPESDSPESAI